MLEIMLLYRLCGWIGNAAREKGQSAISYQLMLIVFWIGGEFGTVLVAGVFFGILGEELPFLLVYMLAFIGGGIGAWFVFKIVAKLPDLSAAEVSVSEPNA